MHATGWRTGLLPAGAIFLWLSLAANLGAAPWIGITEIHYNPLPGQDTEFVEIHSREPPRADLSEWRLEGEISFCFPPGTFIQPGEYLVVAANPSALRQSYPAARRILGPLQGKLDNKGGRVALRNAAGARVCEVRYDTKGKWPASADGAGHTLSLMDPVFDPGVPRNWAASELLGGTPGAANFARQGAAGEAIVKKGAVWKFLRGKQLVGAEWKTGAFDDSQWEEGPGGIGYGDGDDATEVADMRGSYLSVFLRRAFQVKDPSKLSRIILRVDYDDGFIAYLNGREVARAYMGPPGAEVEASEPATGSHEAGVPAEYDLGMAPAVLKPGTNILAVQVHNKDINSTDLSSTVELESRRPSTSPRAIARPVINEVFVPGTGDSTTASQARAFVEVHNPSGEPLDLGGYYLSDDASNLRKFKVPGPLVMKPRGHAVLSAKELGEKFAPTGHDVFLALTSPAGDAVADAVRFSEEGKAGAAGKSGAEAGPAAESKPGPAVAILRARVPDGARTFSRVEEPTPGAPNKAPPAPGIVINEIHYNSPWGDEEEFLEFHNPGTSEVPLAGFELRGAVRCDFSKESIPPGGYLAVARDPKALARRHGKSASDFAGPYEGKLGDGGDEIILKDARKNIVDLVEYGDKAPWPAWADGLGSSLELIDASLDNSLPGAWAASIEAPRSRWATFDYVKEFKEFQGRSVNEIQFLLLGEGECLIDDVQVVGERNLLSDGGFEKGGPDCFALGTHERSAIYREAAAHGKACFRIVAEGRGNARHNYVSFAVPGGFLPGRKYRVRFSARWQRGCAVLLSRTVGQGVAKAHRLPIPARLGTPGEENSAHQKDPPPVVGTPLQDPVAPASGEPVTFSVSISSRARVSGAVIFHRQDQASSWARTLLEPDSGGGETSPRWNGEIPGLPAGKVEFYISARDEAGKEGTFPEGAPARTALYGVGLGSSRKFPTYTLLISDAEWKALSERPRMSNKLGSATLVYGDSRIFHGVGFRRRGSPFTRSAYNWRIVFGEENLDGRRALTLDGQGGDGTRLNERLTYWCLEGLRAPNARQQYVHFRLPGVEEGVYEDVEKVSEDYLENWFSPSREQTPGGAEAKGKKKKDKDKQKPAKKEAKKPGAEGPSVEYHLHKVDDYFELFSEADRAFREADLVLPADPEDVRWNFAPRAGTRGDDFEPLMSLLKVFDPRSTPDKVFEERLEKTIDVEEWLKVLAARNLVDDWDTLGRERGKNSMLFLPSAEDRWKLLPWDCDLAWRSPESPLFTTKFQGIVRILQRPGYRRLFLGYMAYLVERKFDPAAFDGILGDLHAHCSASTDSFRRFAEARRISVMQQIPRYPLQVLQARRVERSGEHDILRSSGNCPITAVRFALDGREGPVRLSGECQWTADLPVGPDGGELTLEALDLGGSPVATAAVKVKARKGALPLPEKEAPVEDIAKPGEIAQAAPGGEAAPGIEPPIEPSTGTTPPAVADGAPAGRAEEKPARASPEPGPAKPRGGAADLAALTLKVARPPSVSEPGGRVEARSDKKAARLVSRRKPTRDEEESPAPPRAAAPPSAGAPAASGSAIKYVLAGMLVLGALQAGILIYSRRKETPAPTESARSTLDLAILDLGSPDFETAARALAELSSARIEDVPALLAALEDQRTAPFHKIRGGAQGLHALPAEGASSIRVRHVAALILERILGKPPVPRPSAADWRAHCKRIAGGKR